MSTPVINRTPREWVEDCDRCRGTGKRRVREFFSLWTPDEYPHTRPIDGVPTGTYVCTAAPGGTIQDACREALEIAGIVKRPVAFKHNGRVVVAREGDAIESVFDQWAKQESP